MAATKPSVSSRSSTLAMLFKATFLVFAIAAIAAGYDLVEDAEGRHFYLVPLHRERRQTNIQVSKEQPGIRVTGSHQGTIINNPTHRLDGSVVGSKTFRPSGPLTVGGGLAYSHKPSGSGVNVGAAHTQGFGTDLSASGNANLWQKGNSRLDAVGNYNRHYGGPSGASKPNYYGGLQFNHRF